MLTLASEIAPALFDGLVCEAPVRDNVVRKVESIATVRRDRDDLAHEISFGARPSPYMACRSGARQRV